MSLKLTILFLTLFHILFNPHPLGEAEDFNLLKNYKLFIPAIFLEANICHIEKEICLDSGVWMKYFDYDGNFLFTGHSFTILPFRAGVFYALSDLEKGDLIYVFFEERFVYVVEDIFVTNRYDLSVENFEEMENSLVLYSCFPLWSASERIVVRATLCDLCEYEL